MAATRAPTPSSMSTARSRRLQAFAEVGSALGDKRILVDGDAIQLGRAPRLVGQHVLTTRHGVAVHVNAFNFPAWGLAEKAAVALLAGMPVLTKPATSSALVAHRLFELLVDAQIWPAKARSRCSWAGRAISPNISGAGLPRVHRRRFYRDRSPQHARRGHARHADQRRGRFAQRRGPRVRTSRPIPRPTTSS